MTVDTSQQLINCIASLVQPNYQYRYNPLTWIFDLIVNHYVELNNNYCFGPKLHVWYCFNSALLWRSASRFVSVLCFVCVYCHCSDHSVWKYGVISNTTVLCFWEHRHFYLFLSASMSLLLFVCCHDNMKLLVSRVHRKSICLIVYKLLHFISTYFSVI